MRTPRLATAMLAAAAMMGKSQEVVLGLFTVTCYRAICEGRSVPDTWITGQSRESAEYHAWHGRAIERRDVGCYHGPFRIIPENAGSDAPGANGKL